jgi:L-fuconolactonase
MKKISVTDSHLHLLDSGKLSYPWLKEVCGLNPAYVLQDMQTATEAANVSSIVLIEGECSSQMSHDEVNYFTVAAKQDPRIKGVVAKVVLEKGILVYSELESLKLNPLVKGVRRLIETESDPFFCMRDEFVEGVQMLAEFDFSFDICIKYHQLPQAIYLVANCPKVKFVLDHMGKPNIAENLLEPWQEQIAGLAKLPNVACKISGIVREAQHKTWDIKHLEPFVKHVLKGFGVDRLMFGSDWPLVDVAADYSRWLDTVVTLLKDLPEENLQKIFSSNANKFYKLENAS